VTWRWWLIVLGAVAVVLPVAVAVVLPKKGELGVLVVHSALRHPPSLFAAVSFCPEPATSP